MTQFSEMSISNYLSFCEIDHSKFSKFLGYEHVTNFPKNVRYDTLTIGTGLLVQNNAQEHAQAYDVIWD